MRALVAGLAVLLVAAPLQLPAAEGEAASDDAGQDAGSAVEEESTLERWREILRFGIDTEILELVAQLKSNRETSLDAELVELAAGSLNPDVIEAVVGMYRTLENAGVVEVGLGIVDEAALEVETSDGRRRTLLTTTIYYLGEVGGPEVAARLEPLIDHEDTLVATAAIAAVGASGNATFAPKLIERLDDLAFTDDLKPELLLALGALGAISAVDRLESLVGDAANPRVWRMYASDALGKIGSASSLDVLREVLGENDPLLKAYAASALGAYENEEATQALVAGLRDSHWRVRAAAATGLGRESAAAAIPILRYKADRDPEPKVQAAAIEALAQIHHPDARGFLTERIEDPERNLAVREEALRSLIQHDLAASTEFIKRVVDTEWASSPPTLLLAIAQELAGLELATLQPFYERFMGSPHPALRVYGVRGVVSSGLRALRPSIEDLRTADTVAAVRLEAELALDKL